MKYIFFRGMFLCGALSLSSMENIQKKSVTITTDDNKKFSLSFNNYPEFTQVRGDLAVSCTSEQFEEFLLVIGSGSLKEARKKYLENLPYKDYIDAMFIAHELDVLQDALYVRLLADEDINPLSDDLQEKYKKILIGQFFHAFPLYRPTSDVEKSSFLTTDRHSANVASKDGALSLVVKGDSVTIKKHGSLYAASITIPGLYEKEIAYDDDGAIFSQGKKILAPVSELCLRTAMKDLPLASILKIFRDAHAKSCLDLNEFYPLLSKVSQDINNLPSKRAQSSRPSRLGAIFGGVAFVGSSFLIVKIFSYAQLPKLGSAFKWGGSLLGASLIGYSFFRVTKNSAGL